MERHPIKTLKALLDMGAKTLSLTPEEAKKLIEHYEKLFDKANQHNYDNGEVYGEAEYGMDK